MQQGLRFLDSFGFRWQVVEIGDQTGPRASVGDANVESGGSGRLYFISRGRTRVLRTYPAQWSQLAWAELEDLCAHAATLGADNDVHPPWNLPSTGIAFTR